MRNKRRTIIRALSEQTLLLASLFLFPELLPAQSVFDGADTALVGNVPAIEFDFRGSWDALFYRVIYDPEYGEVRSFQPVDTLYGLGFSAQPQWPTSTYVLTGDLEAFHPVLGRTYLLLDTVKQEFHAYIWDETSEACVNGAPVVLYGANAAQVNLKLTEEYGPISPAEAPHQETHLFVEFLRASYYGNR